MGAAFCCRLDEFDASNALEKLGALTASASSARFVKLYTNQTTAWQDQLEVVGDTVKLLRQQLHESAHWHLLFEFDIPRRGKRPDAILIADELVFVIEFKIGQQRFECGDIWQTLSYALDLRDFHSESEGRQIVPILVATEAPASAGECMHRDDRHSPVKSVMRVGQDSAARLAESIARSYRKLHDGSVEPIDCRRWESAPYRPSPTIIEAAERLFGGHSVSNISHTFATNLEKTSAVLLEAIQRAQLDGRRIICFVTGIPGAGKTLAGLNAVHNPALRGDGRPSAVFLSGNGPLVSVVREALVRDRQRAGLPRGEAKRTVSTFISNVHGFIETYGLSGTPHPPHECAIVFDEAQRAWDAVAVEKKHGIARSEPELILEIMERSPNWAAVVALVGGGQEIHKGEAGLEEWARAIRSRRDPWTVLASPEALRAGPSLAGHRLNLDDALNHLQVIEMSDLHLNSSVRSPRARRIGEWVNALVGDDPSVPHPTIDASAEFPIFLTRNLATARDWLRERADGDQRCGLLASSGAVRLRADGIELSSGFRRAFPYEEWFLSGREDTRSSLRLEVAATEFECQGLELDWCGLCWGGDFVRNLDNSKWMCRAFRGTKWQIVRQARQSRYIANKYRVLLTRARRGMVICIPKGELSDPTRAPNEFDAIADFLIGFGVPVI